MIWYNIMIYIDINKYEKLYYKGRAGWMDTVRIVYPILRSLSCKTRVMRPAEVNDDGAALKIQAF